MASRPEQWELTILINCNPSGIEILQHVLHHQKQLNRVGTLICNKGLPAYHCFNEDVEHKQANVILKLTFK